MLLLERNIIRKKQVEKIPKLDAGNNDSKEYKVEAICNSIVYSNKLKSYPLELYYLVAWKGYSEEKNTWELILAIQYLQKLIRLFHKDYFKKLIATFLLIDSAPSRARPTIRPIRPTK